jgi:hypothetical protein
MERKAISVRFVATSRANDKKNEEWENINNVSTTKYHFTASTCGTSCPFISVDFYSYVRNLFIKNYYKT